MYLLPVIVFSDPDCRRSNPSKQRVLVDMDKFVDAVPTYDSEIEIWFQGPFSFVTTVEHFKELIKRVGLESEESIPAKVHEVQLQWNGSGNV